jgi:RecA-family ATPase
MSDPNKTSGTSPGFHVVTVRELLSMEFPPVRQIVAPFINEKTLALAYAYRGTGKTYFGLSIGLAAASGGYVFGEHSGRPGWRAPEPSEVLYVDGEMPAETIRERAAALMVGLDCDPEDRLRFLAADLEERGIPNLTERRGQDAIEELVKPGSLLILDSRTTLFRGIIENDADSWDSAQDWFLRLRRRHVAVLLFDHTGKNQKGGPRGNSKKEDVLDTSIELSHPDDYEAEEGARFEIRFEKSRGLLGHDVEPFETTLKVTAGRASWTTKGIDAETTAKMAAMRADGKSDRQIARELGVDHKTVAGRLRKLERKVA